MNQKIVDYLQENKEQYSKESLIGELRKFGYDELEIKNASTTVYNNQNARSKNIVGKVVAIVIIVIAVLIIMTMGVIVLVWLIVYIRVGVLGLPLI